MGLLSVASEKKLGLGAKAEEPSNISFQQWAKQNGFGRCGVFRSKSGLMFLESAYGIDAASVFNSISTKDFWNGSVHSDTWVNLDSESPNFSAFTQFLGTEARSKVQAFRMLKILDDGDLIVFFECAFKGESFARPKAAFAQELKGILHSQDKNLLVEPTSAMAESLLKNGKVRLLLISTKKAFDEVSKKIEVSELTLQKILINTIFEEVFFKAKTLFSSPAVIYSTDPQEIKVAAAINPQVEDELLKAHLSLECKNIIGSEAAEKIIVLTAGYSEYSEEIIDYLLRG